MRRSPMPPPPYFALGTACTREIQLRLGEKKFGLRSKTVRISSFNISIKLTYGSSETLFVHFNH